MVLSAPLLSSAYLIMWDVPINISWPVMQIINDVVKFEALRLRLIKLLHWAFLAHPWVYPYPVRPSVKNDFELFLLWPYIKLCENLDILVVFDRSCDQLWSFSVWWIINLKHRGKNCVLFVLRMLWESWSLGLQREVYSFFKFKRFLK